MNEKNRVGKARQMTHETDLQFQNKEHWKVNLCVVVVIGISSHLNRFFENHTHTHICTHVHTDGNPFAIPFHL